MSPRLHGGHHFIHYVPADMSIITALRIVTGRRQTLFSLGLRRCYMARWRGLQLDHFNQGQSCSRPSSHLLHAILVLRG
jgi:hypothetical protein